MSAISFKLLNLVNLLGKFPDLFLRQILRHFCFYSTRFPYSEMENFFHFKCRKVHFKTAEIVRKLCRKFHSRKRKSRNKFHVKVRKPHLNCGKHFSTGVSKETVKAKMS